MSRKLKKEELADPVTVAEAKSEIVARVRGRGPAPKFNREVYAGKQRHASREAGRLDRQRELARRKGFRQRGRDAVVPTSSEPATNRRVGGAHVRRTSGALES